MIPVINKLNKILEYNVKDIFQKVKPKRDRMMDQYEVSNIHRGSSRIKRDKGNLIMIIIKTIINTSYLEFLAQGTL